METTERTFTLVDDGTMDTVIMCDDCRAAYRYNFAEEAEEDYQSFVEWAMNDMDEQHECGE